MSAEQIKFNINQYYKKKYAEQARMNYKSNKNYKKKNGQKQILGNYIKNESKDIIRKIIKSLVVRVAKVFKKYKIKRELTHMELIGCKPDELKTHLKNKFVEGMTFDNFGEWEVDHKKPVKKFINKFKETGKVNKRSLKYFHYKNLQPLWKADNREKGCKY